MKVLITGANGQLGTDLQRVCADAGDEIVATDIVGDGVVPLDITDRAAVEAAVVGQGLDVVYSVGAYTAVDNCESDPDLAFRVNALAPRWLADAARRAGAHVVHVSTDYVFDGDKPEPYHEFDVPAPASVYGASKAAGEREVLTHHPGAAIARTAWVMGEHGNNMLKTVLSLRDRPELAFVDDQRGCPTFTADLAVALRDLAASRAPGVFHTTNQGDTSWYGLVREILELAGEDPGKVRPITTAELDPPRPARRPANSVLENRTFAAAGLSLLPPYRATLAATVRSMLGD